jgi:hypothetical protein
MYYAGFTSCSQRLVESLDWHGADVDFVLVGSEGVDAPLLLVIVIPEDLARIGAVLKEQVAVVAEFLQLPFDFLLVHGQTFVM